METKRGREKFLLCLIDSSSKLFAPSHKCLHSFLWLSEETDLFLAQRRIIKMKASDGHSTTTAETYKLNNVCNAGFSRSQANASPRISAEYAQRINYSFYIPQYNVVINRKILYFVFFGCQRKKTHRGRITGVFGSSLKFKVITAQCLSDFVNHPVVGGSCALVGHTKFGGQFDEKDMSTACNGDSARNHALREIADIRRSVFRHQLPLLFFHCVSCAGILQ